MNKKLLFTVLVILLGCSKSTKHEEEVYYGELHVPIDEDMYNNVIVDRNDTYFHWYAVVQAKEWPPDTTMYDTGAKFFREKIDVYSYLPVKFDSIYGWEPIEDSASEFIRYVCMKMTMRYFISLSFQNDENEDEAVGINFDE